MRGLLGSLFGSPEQLLLAFEASATLALLLALALRTLLEASPRWRHLGRALTFVIEPLLLVFGIVLVLRLRV